MPEPLDDELLPAVPDVQILRLQPGDTLVLTLRDRMPEFECDELIARLKQRFPNHPAILLERCTLSVLRKEG